MQVALTMVSGNAKTGPIPVSTTERQSCPQTCPFYDKGCYAKYGKQSLHWRKVSNGERGISWSEFTAQIRKIVSGQLWRHNASGDLPHNDGFIDVNKVRELVSANKGRRGYTYTHHVLNNHNVEIIRECNQNGFTVNASTESVEVADKIMTDHGIPAVAVINSNESRRFFRTESGRRVVVCPATIHENVNCSTCGLCQHSDREFIVGFPAHGIAKKTVNELIG